MSEMSTTLPFRLRYPSGARCRSDPPITRAYPDRLLADRASRELETLHFSSRPPVGFDGQHFQRARRTGPTHMERLPSESEAFRPPESRGNTSTAERHTDNADDRGIFDHGDPNGYVPVNEAQSLLPFAVLSCGSSCASS